MSSKAATLPPPSVDPRDIVGRNVRNQRRALGLNQKALGARVRIEQGHISAIERGQGSPSLALLFGLAEALEVSPAALVSSEETWGTELAAALDALCERAASGGDGPPHERQIAAALAADIERMTLAEQGVLVLLIRQAVPLPRSAALPPAVTVSAPAFASVFRVPLRAAVKAVREGCERLIKRPLLLTATDPQHPFAESIATSWIYSGHLPPAGVGLSDPQRLQWALYPTPPAAWYLDQLGAVLRDAPALHRIWRE